MAERVLWREERQRFLRALSTFTRHRERRRAALLLIYDSGARVSEVAALDVADYDPRRGTVILMNIKARGRPRREVGVHEATKRALNAWLRARPEVDSPALFISQKGQRITARTLQRDYDLACLRAGIDGQGIHTLRHTAATRLLDDRILEIHEVADRLGHREKTTTLKYYAHGSPEEAARKIRAHRL